MSAARVLRGTCETYAVREVAKHADSLTPRMRPLLLLLLLCADAGIPAACSDAGAEAGRSSLPQAPGSPGSRQEGQGGTAGGRPVDGAGEVGRGAACCWVTACMWPAPRRQAGLQLLVQGQLARGPAVVVLQPRVCSLQQEAALSRCSWQQHRYPGLFASAALLRQGACAACSRCLVYWLRQGVSTPLPALTSLPCRHRPPCLGLPGQ